MDAKIAIYFSVLVSLWLGLTVSGAAQNIIVKGKVTDAQTDNPLPGVNIKVKGTTTGTSTSSEGKYSLSVPSVQDTLIFSYIGYQTKNVPINGQVSINVILKPTTVTGENLVVIGYGSEKKSNVSGSISSVSPQQLQSNSVLPNAASALEGTTPGVSVTAANGSPGASMNIRVRGSNSFGDNNPLVIVDGVPGNLSDINPEDIKSLQVLKDASAAAIYGSRAANGVIIVETKHGSSGELQVNAKYSHGVQQPTKMISITNARQYAKIDNELHRNASGIDPYSQLKNPQSLRASTDWQNTVYNRAPIWNAYLGISGGNENSTFRVSGAFHKQPGIMAATNYQKGILHFKGRQQKGSFTFGESVSWNDYNRRIIGNRGDDKPMIQEIILAQPVMKVYNPSNLGGFGGGPSYMSTQAYNPLGLLTLNKNTHHDNNFNLNVYGTYNFLTNFTYKINAGYRVFNGYHKNYEPQYFFSNTRQNTHAYLSEIRGRTHHWILENTLHYNQSFGKNNVDVLGGFTAEENHRRTTSGTKQGFPNNSLAVLDAGTGYSISAGGNDHRWDLYSVLGRVKYNFNELYYISGNIRRDASSRSGPSNRVGVFPSASVGWRVSNQQFFANVSSVLSNLKIRASYGELGNEPSGYYAYQPTITYSTNLGYLFGGSYQSGAALESFTNPDVQWEETKDLDIGANIGFMHKVHFTVDYYLDKTSNLLLNVPIPPSTGASSNSPLVNTGEVQNQGVEFDVKYDGPDKRNFSYTITANVSTVQNRVNKLGFQGQVINGTAPHRASTGPITEARVGYPMGAFFMKQTDGLFQSEKEINNYTHDGNLIQPKAKPGDVRYVDVNNDGRISSLDRKYSGSPFPDLKFGLNFSSNYKNWDFTLFIQGTHGNKMFDTNTWISSRGTIDFNFNSDLLNAWTPQNTNTDVPRLTFTDPNHNSDPSTRFLYDASYLRFKTVQVGYTIPTKVLNRVGIGKLRLFVNAHNLWTISKYPGYDPTYTGDGLLNRGLDQGLYPVARIITGGVNLNF